MNEIINTPSPEAVPSDASDITLDNVPISDAVPPSEVLEESTTPFIPVSALSTRLDDLSTTDFLLLLIFVVMLCDKVLHLFIRKWGFPEW